MSSTNEGRDAREPQTPTAPNTGTRDNKTNDTNRRRSFHHTRKTGSKNTAFKEETDKLKGNVFQMHSERVIMSQFMETLEALRIY